MAEAITTDIDRAPDWWAAWFDADYSWDGLARRDDRGKPVHPWEGWVVVDEAYCAPKDDAPDGATTRPASLQDYWRADPGEDQRLRDDAALKAAGELLTGDQTPDGRTWHIVHLPPAGPPGAPPRAEDDAAPVSFKADLEDSPEWARLDTVFKARLGAAETTQTDRLGMVKGADRRALLDGAVFKASPTPSGDEASPVHLSARRSVHLGDAGYKKAQFGSASHWVAARFAQTANFDSASFSGDADFESASFSGYATFQSALFLRHASYDLGQARDQNAGRLVRREKSADAGRGSQDDVGDFDLILTTGAARRETGGFKTLKMVGAISLGGISFENRVFGQAPTFEDARFHGPAEFFGARMHEGAKWQRARFQYDDARLYGDDALSLSWSALAATLAERPSFQKPGKATQPNTLLLGDFVTERLEAKEKLSWRGPSPTGDRWRDAWRAAFLAWRDYAAADPVLRAQGDPTGRNWEDSDRKREDDDAVDPKAIQAERAPDFEQAFRRLKLLMREQGAHLEEQRFFACELRARQARNPKDDDVTRWEIWAARAYGLFSGYGADLARPLAWLGGLWVAFALIYFGLAVSTGTLDRPEPVAALVMDQSAGPASAAAQTATHDHGRGPIEALFAPPVPPDLAVRAASWRQLFGPAVFSAEMTLAPIANPIRHHPWAQRLSQHEAGGSVWFAWMRLLHRALSVPLLFLLALTLRRRFQLG